MEKSKEVAQILNDLIEINNDRIAGYEKAGRALREEDADLKSLFDAMIVESRQIKADLIHEVQVLRADVDNQTTEMGNIYRAWQSVKSVFSGNGRHAILSDCESWEDAVQQAYRKALQTDKIPAFIREMLTQQQATLKTSHDEVKELRDQYA